LCFRQWLLCRVVAVGALLYPDPDIEEKTHGKTCNRGER
jgi:hypothetical protein